MKIGFLSDTHTFHDKLLIPECDIIVHSGDYTFTGSIPEVNKFMNWFSSLKCEYRVLVNGNHEKMFWQNASLFKSLIPDNIHYLEDSYAVINGLTFYGSPHTKEFGGWAYPYFTKGEAEAIWSKIPLETDVLVTHMPPYGIRDGAPYKMNEMGIFVEAEEDGESVGCEVLLEMVKKVKPMIHSFGHIHEGRGVTQKGSTTFINASICNGKYKPINPCIVVTLNELRQIEKIKEYPTEKGFTTVDKRRR